MTFLPAQVATTFLFKRDNFHDFSWKVVFSCGKMWVFFFPPEQFRQKKKTATMVDPAAGESRTIKKISIVTINDEVNKI